MKQNKELYIEMYKNLFASRVFEERLIEMYAAGKIPGHIHSGVGEEAVYVGTVASRKEGDYFKFTHRNVGSPNILGMSYDKIFAEILGKATGNSIGRGGINHIAELDKGVIGLSGALGCDISIGVGAAYTLKLSKTDNIAYVFLGDGTTSRGAFHESLNWASAWKLPVLFIVNNNEWSISTHISETCNVVNPGADRASAYGMASKVVDGTDLLEVYEAAKELADHVRGGNGPAILETKTYRWRGHFEGDQAKYRDSKITEEWLKKDCVKGLEDRLIGEGLLTKDEINDLRKDINSELDKAIAFAEASPEPSVEDIFNNIYAD